MDCCGAGHNPTLFLELRTLAQMNRSCAPSVFSMKSAALMMPSTSSYRSLSLRWFMSADIRHAHLRDRLLHLGGGHRGHAGNATETLRHVRRGIAQDGEFQVVHPGLGDHVEAPEREEQMRLDTLAECRVRENQAWVGHVQGSLGADDCQLATGVCIVVEGRDDRRRGLDHGHVSSLR